MTGELLIAALVAAALTIYLLYALFNPSKF